MLQPSISNLQRWSKAGLVSACLQFVAMVSIAIDAESVGMIVLALVAFLFMCAYGAFHRIVMSGKVSEGHKYFCIVHIIVATWCFFLATLTLALHVAGFQVLTILLDGNSSNDLTPRARAHISPLFIAVLLGLVVDGYAVNFHTKRLRGESPLTEFPVAAARLQVVVDIVMVTVTASSISLTKNLGFIAPLVIALASLAVQLRHVRSIHRDHLPLDAAPFLAMAQIEGQLLSLQHALLSSTVFLVDLGMLLMYSLGGTVFYFLGTLPGVSRFTVFVGVAGYAGLLATTIVVVGLATQINADEVDGRPWASESMAFTATPGSPLPSDDTWSTQSRVPRALPVALAQRAPMAVGVALPSASMAIH